MLKSEYDAYTTEYNNLLKLEREKADMLRLKASLEANTLVNIQVGFATGINDSSSSRLSGLKTDLLTSIDGEISALNTAITTSKVALIALEASTEGLEGATLEDPAFQ